MSIWLLCRGSPAAPTPGVVAAAPVDPIPASSEPPPPAGPGSPEQSLAARPGWDAGGQYAPQAPAEARPFSAPADGDVQGLVVCSIEADASDPQGLFGGFAAPDLTTTLTLDRARMTAVGPEDSRTMRIPHS